MKRIGIIGYGATGAAMVEWFSRNRSQEFSLAALCLRERQSAAARRAVPPETRLCVDIEEFLDVDLDIVIEAAGHSVVRDCGARVLARGCELQILSTGALADTNLRDELRSVALASGGRITIPAGALAGFRGLMTLREAGLTSVTYTSTKPPLAWMGTPAAEACDLLSLDAARVIFDGNAGEAARRFPANANLAAAVALAGIGFADTAVRLIADPATELNIGRIEAESPAATLDLRVAGKAFAANPKTSAITAMSVIAALQNSADRISFV